MRFLRPLIVPGAARPVTSPAARGGPSPGVQCQLLLVALLPGQCCPSSSAEPGQDRWALPGIPCVQSSAGVSSPLHRLPPCSCPAARRSPPAMGTLGHDPALGVQMYQDEDAACVWFSVPSLGTSTVPHTFQNLYCFSFIK